MTPNTTNTTASRSESREDAWLTSRRFAGALALVIFAAFPGVLLNSSSFVFRDFGLFGYPLAHHFRESFWRGEIPLWNPLNNCGLPFLAQWNTMVCYPPSLVYLVFPLPWSLNLFCLLHLLLAGVTMFFLALRWTDNRLAASVAGLAFAFSGTVLSTLMWPNGIAVFSWMPAVILCCERAWQEGGRRLVVAGVVGAMQMLAGLPELIFFTWLIVLALWADQWWQKNSPRAAMVRRFVVVVALVTGLSAVQLLPFLDLLLHSDRSTQSDADTWSMPFSGLANYLVPLFRTDRTPAGVHVQPNQYLLSSVYAGIGVLGLALWALVRVRQRRVWLLGAMLLVSVWLALGDKGHLYAWLRQAFPSANFMRFPAKFALVGAFLLPLLAAIGVQEWTMGHPAGRKLPLRSVLIWSFLSLGCGATLAIAFFRPLHQTDWPVTLHSALTRLLFLGLIGGALWALAWLVDEKKRLAVSLSLLALVLLDGITHVPWQNPVAPPSVYSLQLPVLEQMDPKPTLGQSRAFLNLKAQKQFHDRMLSNQAENFLVRRMALFFNCNLIDHIPKVDGFYALYLSHEREVHFRLYDAEGAARTNLADFLGISQVTSKDDLLQWTARRNSLPLVTAGQQPVFLDPAATLTNLMRDAFNPRDTVFLPVESRQHLTATNRSDCLILSSPVTAHRVVATIESAQPALVVVSQVDYHPWQATVDGCVVPIERANFAFQAVEVPAGKHEVQLVYRDRSFQAGLLLTTLTLLTGAAIWRRMRPLHGRRHQAQGTKCRRNIGAPTGHQVSPKHPVQVEGDAHEMGSD